MGLGFFIAKVLLEQTGAPYDAVRVDFASSAQRAPEFLRLNPKGRVPALATPQGTLTETPALLAYVAQSFPAARLAPADAYGFARLQEFHSYLASTVHIAHAHRPRASRCTGSPEAAHPAEQARGREHRRSHARHGLDHQEPGWVRGLRDGVQPRSRDARGCGE